MSVKCCVYHDMDCVDGQLDCNECEYLARYEKENRDLIDRVLEIIDDVFMEVANGLIHTSSEALEETRNRVKALRGEQE